MMKQNTLRLFGWQMMKQTTHFFKYTGSLQDHWKRDSVNYCGDTSGKVLYRFNEYGFRETNCDLEKPVTFVCGCSNTFGVGLNYEDTWAYKLGLNHLNFSQGGASNAYIARTLIMQSEKYKPELIIAHFSYIDRIDYLVVDKPYSSVAIGKWVLEDKNHKGITGWANNYYSHYSDIDGTYLTLINMLLLQSYCQLNNIPLILMCVDTKRFILNTDMQNLRKMINLQDFSLNDFNCDRAHDGRHWGEKTNTAFANKLRMVVDEILQTR